MKILVVEDEPAIRLNLELILQAEGYEVVSAHNGVAGRIAALEQLPDIVVSDVLMPGMNGLALLEALRANPLTAHIPVVLLSARADREDIRGGMTQGADDYLTKPFEDRDLLAAIRSQLEKLQARGRAASKLAAQSQRLIHYDDLTGLANATLLKERLEAALSEAGSTAPCVSLIFVSLKNFASVNNSLGRIQGDALLGQIAHRLQEHHQAAHAGMHSIVARVENTVFALLASGLAGKHELSAYATEISGLFSRPFEIPAGEQFVQACVGAALYPDDAGDAESLMGAVGAALHAAQSVDSRRPSLFQAGMRAQASQHRSLLNDLFRALDQQEISLHYQPQIDIATNRLIGFEALMRWRQRQRGLVSPMQFIPLAESSGHILQLGAWALEEACRQMAQWRSRGLGPCHVAVNVSAKQFYEGDLAAQVRSVLNRHDLPASCLELEITESTAMCDGEVTAGLLHELKDIGVRLALDDFGTGYSSLAYLKQFPLHVLKIDQTFVRNVLSDPGDRAIVKAVIDLAHNFEMSVIAEAVELPEQLALLRTLGCNAYQGYYFSRPLPADEVEKFFPFAAMAPRPQTQAADRRA